MDQLIAEIKKIPPVTRFIVGSSLGITIPVLMKLVSPYSIVFFKAFVVKKFQVGYFSEFEYRCLSRHLVLENLHFILSRR